ncbi:hypothetical protein [Mangrovibacterium lignilyticum]|uniref:hypothetical protein n=1 Tax=Mangrovibacterium lignilyticum TaxID=2668052 RepID=UPI0013CFBAF0|nr:hypothetical protein [Mangrovibacterium lignilyticum]
MNQAQSFNLSSSLFSNYAALFVKLVLLLVIAYLAVMLFNLIRDKFISPATEPKKEEITGLFTILHKLFTIGGWGFIIGNVLHTILGAITHSAMHNRPQLTAGNWDYLLFGVILIFVGKGLNAGLQQLKKA